MARCRDEQSEAAQYLRSAADVDERRVRGQVGRHDFEIDARVEEVKTAGSDEENGKQEAADHAILFRLRCGFSLTKNRAAGLPAARRRIGTPWLFGYKSVAVTLHVVVRGEDVSLLLCDELTNGQREILIENICVSFFGFIFALLCGFEEGVVAAA